MYWTLRLKTHSEAFGIGRKAELRMESDGENNQSTPWFISKINDAAVKSAPCTAADSRQRQGADGCVRPSVAYIFIQRNPCDTLTAARIRSSARWE